MSRWEREWGDGLPEVTGSAHRPTSFGLERLRGRDAVDCRIFSCVGVCDSRRGVQSRTRSMEYSVQLSYMRAATGAGLGFTGPKLVHLPSPGDQFRETDSRSPPWATQRGSPYSTLE